MKRKNIIHNARELRRDMTEAEKHFWRFARDKKFNQIKFRRQHPVDSFVLDFYWAEKKLAIEIDGGIHLKKEIRENDAERSRILYDAGITVIRFTNEEVLSNIGHVLRRIVAFGESLPHP